MYNKKIYDVNIAIDRLKNYCAVQDRCQWDVIRKMKEWRLTQNTQDHIHELLISNQYINEERFAISFCQGKFRIKKWGKNKIKNELKKRDISKNCIIKGLDSIDEDQYQEILKKIIEQKTDKSKEKNPFIKKNKIAKYLIQKGFENNLIWDILR
tara:strand:+ start:89 stop:550 length:462 start_codon:yes stop_codon:yes gene_type:complete